MYTFQFSSLPYLLFLFIIILYFSYIIIVERKNRQKRESFNKVFGFSLNYSQNKVDSRLFELSANFSYWASLEDTINWRIKMSKNNGLREEEVFSVFKRDYPVLFEEFSTLKEITLFLKKEVKKCKENFWSAYSTAKYFGFLLISKPSIGNYRLECLKKIRLQSNKKLIGRGLITELKGKTFLNPVFAFGVYALVNLLYFIMANFVFVSMVAKTETIVYINLVATFLICLVLVGVSSFFIDRKKLF